MAVGKSTKVSRYEIGPIFQIHSRIEHKIGSRMILLIVINPLDPEPNLLIQAGRVRLDPISR